MRYFKSGLAALLSLFLAHCTVSHPAAEGRNPQAEAKAAASCDVAALRKFPTNTAFIAYCYCMALERVPSPDEIKSGQEVFARNPDRFETFLRFVSSEEFQKTQVNGAPISSQGPEAMVAFAYERILRRKPTAEELSRWKTRVEKEKLGAERIAGDVLAMRESRALNRL